MSLPAINAEAMILMLLRRLETVENLEASINNWEGRLAVEQAKGILAERHDISLDDAFDLLRHYSRNHNMKLRSVADALIDDDIDIPAPVRA